MLQRRVLAGAWILIVGLAGSALGQSSYSPLPSDAALGRLGLQKQWWGFATIDSIRDRVKFFMGDEQITVVESATGTVTVFDNATGRRRWAVQVGATTDTRYPPTTTDQAVLVVSGRKLFGLDKQTGDAVWEVDMANAPSTSAAADDQRAFVGAIDGSVYAFNLKFLGALAKDITLRKRMYRALDWTYRTGGRVPFAPVSTGVIVCVPSEDGSLYGLDTKNHHTKFQFETDQPLGAPIGQLGNQIVVASKDLKVYSLNADSGALKWEILMGLNVRQTPRIIDEHVFVVAEGAGMRCLSSKDGREVWENRQAVRFLAATPAVVYASSHVDDVLLLSRTTGQQLGAIPLRGLSLRIANDRTDRLYLASERGLVLCLRERERDYPLFHKQPEKRPVEPEIAPDDAGKAKTPAKAAPKKGEEAEDPDPAAPAKAPPKKAPSKAPAVKKAPKPPVKKPAADE
ncbi:MAG TPA: PQQ-binding-like beta-propeller repeat protein [Planctomycetaceae bacterium]|jgi:outer membrane protein assembly factor BamB|nr:PQQ-binding-like beta-propeller repeat protein [Planctomycetaceae bacterium]